jgi:DNA invertase Pin-like site-specific DNA recombinase
MKQETRRKGEKTMGKLVSYVRVSTQRQGASGLGLDAQRAAVAAYAAAAGHSVVMEVQEVESGNRCDRPQLAHALAMCRLHRAVLCVAKLDRLSRNVAFLATLMDSGVEFVACDNPHATRLTLHILAAVAENEATAISHRTKVALAQAKARGVVLGGSRNHRLTDAERRAGSVIGGEVRAAKARERAAAIIPIISELRSTGFNSLAALATGLNRRGIPTANGSTWYPATVRNVLRSAK